MRWLGAAVWPEIAAPIVAVPIGSCEQHGPHLPLDTDTRIAVAVASGLAVARADVVIAPPVALTASGEHSGFPGTLSIGTDVLAALLIELVRSAGWSAGVVFVNGHGGNRDAVIRAAGQSAADGRRVLDWWPRVGGDAHAGRTETSLMLAIDPSGVRADAMRPGRTEPIEQLLPTLRASGVRSVSPNGVLGDPAGATADEGRRLLDAMVADLIGRVATWA